MRLFLIATLLAIVAPTFSVVAEEPPQATRLEKIIAPYLDEQTIFALHADLMAFDTAATIEKVAELFAWPDATRDFIKAQAAPIDLLTQTLPGGATIDVFLLASLFDITRLPFFLVLPTDNSTPASAIALEARRDIQNAWRRPVSSEEVGKALVTGSPETIERLKKSTPVARPEFALALAAAGDSPVRIAIVPSAELRRLIEGIMPQLPGALGGGSTKAFTQGIVWASIALDLPPNDAAVRVVIQSVSPEAAAALEQEIGRVFEAMGKLELVRDATDQFDELSKHLVPKASGDQLTLELTDENGGIAALTTLMGPTIRALYASIPPR